MVKCLHSTIEPTLTTSSKLKGGSIYSTPKCLQINEKHSFYITSIIICARNGHQYQNSPRICWLIPQPIVDIAIFTCIRIMNVIIMTLIQSWIIYHSLNLWTRNAVIQIITWKLQFLGLLLQHSSQPGSQHFVYLNAAERWIYHSYIHTSVI